MKKIFLIILLIIIVISIGVLIFLVLEKTRLEKCPICPLPTEWSKCIDNKQTRINYKCGPETDYKCQSYTEERDCEVSPQPDETEIRISELNEGLETWREKMIKPNPDVTKVSLYVLGKLWLNQPIPDGDAIVAYFDSQQDPDGAWTGAHGPLERMFEAHRILYAYFLLGAAPKNSMDNFFSGYDTLEDIDAYRESSCSYRHSCIYHAAIAWILYYHRYPEWMDEVFNQIEEDLSWTEFDTTGIGGMHSATHILYTYYIARRDFPNLDGLVDSTLALQENDGGFPYYNGARLYATSIALNLLRSIRILYPDFRAVEIEDAIARSRNFHEKMYRTAKTDSTTAGYFSLEEGEFSRWQNLMGIMGASMNGFLDVDFDPTLEEVVKTIH